MLTQNNEFGKKWNILADLHGKSDFLILYIAK